MKRPLVLLSCSLIVGILTGFSVRPERIFWLCFIIFTALAVKALVFSLRCYSKKELGLGFLVLFIFFYGIFSAQYTTAYPSIQLEPFFDKEVTVIGEVKAVTSSGTYSYLTLKPDKILCEDTIYDADTKIRISMFGNKTSYAPGNTVTVTGTLRKIFGPDFYGDFDGFSYFASKGIFGTISADDKNITVNSSKIKLVNLNYTAFTIREKISSVLSDYFSERKLALTERILTGQTKKNDDALSLDLQKSGISHITAVSGQHVGYFLLFAGQLLYFIDIKKKRYLFVAAVPLLLYSIIIGFLPSLVRAVLMALYRLVIVFLGLRHDSLTSLFVSTLVLCIINPYIITHTGFQLSFLSVLAMITVSSFYKKHKRTVPRFIFTLLLTPVTILIFIMPVVAKHYNTLVIASVFTNLLASPFVIAIMLFGYILCLFPISAPISAPITEACAEIILKITETFSKIPFFSIEVPSPNIKLIILYASAVAFLIYILFGKRKQVQLICIVAIFAVSSIATDFILTRNTSYVSVLPSANTEAVYINTNDGYNILINLYDNSENYLKSRAISEIDALFITRATAEIHKSLEEILLFTNVKAIYMPNKTDKNENILNFEHTARINGIKLFTYDMYDTVEIGNSKIKAIYNKPSDKYGAALKVLCNDNTIISAGSLSDDAERSLARRNMKCNLLIINCAYNKHFVSSTNAEYIAVIDKTGAQKLADTNILKSAKNVFETRYTGCVTFSMRNGGIYDYTKTNFSRKESLFWQ